MAMRRYILMPSVGVQPRRDGRHAGAMLRALPRAVSTQPSVSCTADALGPAGEGVAMRMVDAVRENGSKLVELSPKAAAAITASAAPVRLVPLVTYALPAKAELPANLGGARPTGSLLSATVTVICQDAKTGKPVANSKVSIYSDYGANKGKKGVTDAKGRVVFTLKTGWIDTLFVEAAGGYWGAYRSGVAVQSGQDLVIELAPIDMAHRDARRLLYPTSRFNPATGVKVGVIDTGIGPHASLRVEHLENTVTGEPKSAGGDWVSHGTHVAGLIGAAGPAGGFRGMAPGVTLRGYRVFGENAEEATNYAILKALLNAVDDGCDIVNLSLGGDDPDPVVAEGIRDARAQGVLVVVAAGNGGRGPVDYPAAYVGATAVAALGVRQGLPGGAHDECFVLRPPASTTFPDEFIAAFSDYGPQVSVVAPGVGLVSTVPGDRFATMSGTSMATPVVAGAAASLLSQWPAVYALPRDQARSDQIEKLLLTACRSRGFPKDFEGAGLPDPTLV